MKKYKNDVSDIIEFIENSTENSNENFFETLKRFTADIDEEYLTDRANLIKEEVNHNERLLNAFKRLAAVCSDRHCSQCTVRKFCNTYISNLRLKVNSNKLQMVDLFCGAGGLSLGFTQEGFVTALANDIEECCVDTYAYNHPETNRKNIILGDIRQVTDHLEVLLKGKEIDIVVGGPPCQGFSTANRQRLIDDPRNKLYKSYVEIVKRVNPKFFVMENVKGMKLVANQVVEDFKKIGYSVEFNILNAKDYGVPQNRERLIYIGNRIGIDNNKVFEELFSLSKTIPNFILKDALFGLRKLEASRKRNSTEVGSIKSGYKIEKCQYNKPNEYISYINQERNMLLTLNHKARYNNDRDIEIYSRLNQGDRSDDPKIADIMPYKRRNSIFKDKYFKLEENKICKTITAHMKFDCNMYIHPTQARGLTPREAARIQSYPDDYYFKGAYTKTYMQIGNSVPPLLGRAIAKIIKKYLEE